MTITGPRQSGKTTICRQIFKDKPYGNLEFPDTRQFAMDDPRGFLAQFPNGAVIYEIQRAPDLTSYIQPMVDENPSKGQYILTGNQQFEVRSSVNQSLAGRSALVKLLAFDLNVFSSGSMLFPVEIKSGMTVTRDYFKGLNHFKTLFEPHMPSGSGLVYDGIDAQNRSDVSVVPRDWFHKLFNQSCR